MYQQSDDDKARICSAWLAQVADGKRPGKRFLQNVNGMWALGENGITLGVYIDENYRGFYSFENLDKALHILEKSNRLVGYETSSSGDISKGESHGSISLESAGDIRTVLSRALNSI